MNAQVSVVMGSISDWSTMKLTVEILDKLNVPYEKAGGIRSPDAG